MVWKFLQDEDKYFNVPLFSDDSDDNQNSHKHNQQMLLGNVCIDNNHILSILQDSCVNNDVNMTTTTGGNKMFPSHRCFWKS